MRTLYFYHELQDEYEKILNDNYETVSICGFEYDQGHALRQLDECAFDCSVNEWVREEFEELTTQELTEDEKEHYLLSDHQIVYCLKYDME